MIVSLNITIIMKAYDILINQKLAVIHKDRNKDPIASQSQENYFQHLCRALSYTSRDQLQFALCKQMANSSFGGPHQ